MSQYSAVHYKMTPQAARQHKYTLVFEAVKAGNESAEDVARAMNDRPASVAILLYRLLERGDIVVIGMTPLGKKLHRVADQYLEPGVIGKPIWHQCRGCRAHFPDCKLTTENVWVCAKHAQQPQIYGEVLK